jgi:hypothetical protein
MNFKKIALVAALTASFGAQAALEDITGFAANDMVSGEEIATLSTTVYGDYLDATGDGLNTAYVIQTSGLVTTATGGSLAYINQVDGNNYAIVMQQGQVGLAYVNQTGGTPSNKAFVVQIDTDAGGSAPRSIDLLVDIGAKTAADFAQAEFKTPTALTTSGSVAFISQVADVEANTALVYQNGSKLIAAVSQESGAIASDAYIIQVGAGMRAYISQK